MRITTAYVFSSFLVKLTEPHERSMEIFLVVGVKRTCVMSCHFNQIIVTCLVSQCKKSRFKKMMLS